MARRFSIPTHVFNVDAFLRIASRWLGTARSSAAAVSASTMSPTTSEAPAVSASSAALQVREVGTIALISSQLVLVLLVINQFQLESRTFFNVMLLGTAGFVVHALLPLQYRLSFFTLLSFAAIVVALGPVDGIFLVVLGLVLIGICHLPVRMARPGFSSGRDGDAFRGLADGAASGTVVGGDLADPGFYVYVPAGTVPVHAAA